MKNIFVRQHPMEYSFPTLLIWVCSLSIFLSSCSDPCDNTQCFNGGSCDDGVCNCPPGYSGVNCEIYDPCSNTLCLNGGNCVNGLCDCPPGFTGTNCEIHLQPKSMIINKLVVNSYPKTQQNGQGWDALYPGSFGAAPEMYAVVQRNSQDIGISYFVQNASYAQPVNLTFSNTVKFYPLNGRCDVDLYDGDANDDQTYPDPIGGYYFFPDDYSNTTPSIIQLYNPAAWHGIKIDLYVTWKY